MRAELAARSLTWRNASAAKPAAQLKLALCPVRESHETAAWRNRSARRLKFEHELLQNRVMGRTPVCFGSRTGGFLMSESLCAAGCVRRLAFEREVSHFLKEVKL